MVSTPTRRRTAEAESDEESLLSERGLAAVRRHPRFREAAETLCANALAHLEAEDEAIRWLTKDLGRASLLGGAVIMDTWPGGVSVARLAASAEAFRACSRGRVMAWVQYAQAAGHLVIPPGSEPWTQRRLTLKPGISAFVGGRLRGNLEAAALLAPEAREALALLHHQGALQAALTETGRLTLARRGLTANSHSPMHLFLARESGMRVLQHLLLRQAPTRERLLERATFSRAEISRRYAVSRVHLNKLVADAQAQGLLSLAAQDTVVFDRRLSDDCEAYFALTFQFLRLSARAVIRARM